MEEVLNLEEPVTCTQPHTRYTFYLFIKNHIKMAKFAQAMAVSFGAFAGGAAGFYFLEMYKIKAKEERLAKLMEKKRDYENSKDVL
ncbi:hypothetical protein CLU79DRAFT_883435 [Phycomyces nitens]|nr:hypothetical protein CLU79DRAFT_883435 [Phycomyces nitens]